jgi:NAD(P)-dependent dehydrogenase (short-subunit alcohol dehydrogenase family)
MKEKTFSKFDLTGRVAVITGGAGLLGKAHAHAIAEAGGIPVLADIQQGPVEKLATAIQEEYKVPALGVGIDITKKAEVENLLAVILEKLARVDILINNAANNPKVSAASNDDWTRFENFSIDIWEADLAVGLTGAFLCSQVLGTEMAKRGKGVIVNISSDLGVIAPDQRLYEKEGTSPDKQPVKPVTYSVAKTGLIGLTRYLATYWANQGVRVNALCPGGVEAGQPQDFKERLHSRIPMQRMAQQDEYQGAILFLASDASSYMTGASLSIDGGRTCW